MGAGDEGDGVEDSGHQRGTCLCLRSHSVGQAEAGSLGSLCIYLPGLERVSWAPHCPLCSLPTGSEWRPTRWILRRNCRDSCEL